MPRPKVYVLLDDQSEWVNAGWRALPLSADWAERADIPEGRTPGTIMSLKPKVALSQDFLLNLASLPSATHSKVLKWAIRFQSDSTSLRSTTRRSRKRDSNRAVRIDQDWCQRRREYVLESPG